MASMPGYGFVHPITRDLVVSGGKPSDHRQLFAEFVATVQDPVFPCYGARKALGSYDFGFCACPVPITHPEAPHIMHGYFQEWIEQADYARLIQPSSGWNLASCAVVFADMPTICEDGMEQVLWRLLSKLHQLDPNHWAKNRSSFVYDSAFAYSVGGFAHFCTLLHPQASSQSRRFHRVLTVFNPHFIFDHLRAAGLFDHFRTSIRKRDAAANGGYANPKLADTANGLEAPQYALTANPRFDIGPCPFTKQPRPSLSDYDMSR